ncbi:MAG: hypothetical protein AAF745_15715, partial [Planctomycetota bacterium]
MRPSHAVDRAAARFRKALLSRSDVARMSAMNAIPKDFQNRLAAMPIVIKALKTLADDPRFTGDSDRVSRQGEPDLPDGIRAMIGFIGSIDRPENTASLVGLLDGPRASWAMASMMTLGKHKHRGALQALERASEGVLFRDSYGFRFTLAKTLKQLDDPDAWDALARLYDRLDGQLAYRLRQEFEKVVVEDFRDDPMRFQSWRARVGLPIAKAAEKNSDVVAKDSAPDDSDSSTKSMPGTSRLFPSASQASYYPKRRLKPSHYYGIEIYAKRLLFVIDRSGSMNQSTSGTRRIDLAKRELIIALEGLDERCQFGILVF